MGESGRRLFIILALAALGLGPAAASPAAAAPSEAEKAPAKGPLGILRAHEPAPAKEAPAAPAAPKPPTMGETLSNIAVLAREVASIDERLHRLEKSVAGIDASLVPVGAALKPEGLRNLMNLASDLAYERARSLILLLSACAAGLIVLQAALSRWVRARGPA